MGLFDKIFGTDNKIKVEFIDNFTGQTICISEMTAAQLPETFSMQTTLHIQDHDWSVEEAIPENAADFIKTKSLILKMRKIEQLNPNDLWFTKPTISNELPQTISRQAEAGFQISIHEDDYRQNEFLNLTALPQIEEELSSIKAIWENSSEKNDEYTLFKDCHVRKKIGLPDLKISLHELKYLLGDCSMGQVIINEETVLNGFAMKTASTTYYGLVSGDTVTELCMAEWSEKTIAEILKINKSFDVVFVSWCQHNLIQND